MSRDLKTGMLIGLVVVTIAAIAISMWPGAAVEDRMRKNYDRTAQKTIIVTPAAPAAGEHVNIASRNETPAPQRQEVARAAQQVVQERPQPPVTAPAPRIHTVTADENLSTIAQVHYGDASKWPLIAEANKDVLPDVHRVRPGMRLVIPLPKSD
ncbi:MAG: LysM peptidoglycan-binding domain-containing protein [Phycisphaerae bacterium]|nr:LysM peptidoglycan-binding domain-containing protein [Phycisphaerae bacterium]